MEKKILIIDDNPEQYLLIQKWFVGIGLDEIIPNLSTAQQMPIVSKSKQKTLQFVEKLIRDNYQDIELILCDIKFINDAERGIEIVKHIRQLKNLTPSNWASMIPIIGMTAFSDNETSINDMIKAGADYAFNKAIITNNQIENQKTLRAIIETQIRKFQMNLESFYPPTLKDEIITNKNKYKNKKIAFIMSAFRHNDYIEMAKDVLKSHGIIPVVAKGRVGKFDDKVWENILIHMNVCDFGIAIYADDSLDNEKDKKERDKMNPNVSIEVGYVLGLHKKVLFLKHDNLPKLPSDFGGEHYASFNNYETIKNSINEWLENRGFVVDNDTNS